MSLTSYRAAPPRVEEPAVGDWRPSELWTIATPALLPSVLTVKRKVVPFFAGLATTYSPMS